MDMDGTWLRVKPYEDRYRYNHKELTKGLGWYAYGARYYDAAIGRFTGVDPIGDRFPHVTTFNYAENTPINAIDLHGLQAFFVHGLQSRSGDWKTDGFQRIEKTLIQFTNNKTIDDTFDWSDKASLINVTSQRTQAAIDLAGHVLTNNVPGEDVTLIGVSHGGNVVLQAAKILNEISDGRVKVNIITLNTPEETDVGSTAADKLGVTNSWENPIINEGINDMIQITTDGDWVARGLSTELGEYNKTKMKQKGFQQLEIKSAYSWLSPINRHSTKNVDVGQILNSTLKKLKPIPEKNQL